MSILRRKPKRELGHLMRKQDQLEGRLASARTAVDRAHEARNAALLDGDPDDAVLSKHDVACVAAESHLVGLERAADENQKKITDAEATVAADRARVEREAASGEMLAQVALVRDAVEQLRTCGQRLVEVLMPMSTLPAAGPFLGHVALTLKELPGAIEREIVAVAEQRAAEILAGHAPRVPPVQLVAEPAPPLPPAIERRQLIVFQNSKWSENGETKFAQKFALVDLPAPVAERAISRNLGDDPNSIRGKTLRAGVGISHGTIHFAPNAVDLDQVLVQDEPAPRAQEDAESMIGEPVIGQPRTLLVDAERMRI
jgi:hypothetical protein